MNNEADKLHEEMLTLARKIGIAEDSGRWEDVRAGWAVDLADLVCKYHVTLWISRHVIDFEDDFDMAVACAYDLDLLDHCDVNGDRTAIPVWIQKMTKEALTGKKG